MKKAILIAAVGLAGLAAGVSHAANTAGTFNVNITLNSTCSLGTISPLAFTYTSFQAGAQAATGGGFSVTCTNSLPYTFGLQAGNGAPVAPGTGTIAVTDSAVNLSYTVGTSAAGGTGSGAAQNYNVTGTMGANQSGTCSGATCTNAAATNNVHTLILNY